ncbi:hypothetical protein ACROYT_G043717 [Oculina patagonica]
MMKGKILIAVVALTFVFLLAGFALSLFQIPEDKVVGTRFFESGVMEKTMRTNQQHAPVDVLKFFHLDDALEVSWAHAVNSRAKLQEALSGEAMMLEADVLLRPADGMPIMAHPPETDSDLSLEQFLKETIGSSKGIKLDFKSTSAVEPSLKILLDMTTDREVNNPIWLNTDVLPGPCQKETSHGDAIDPHIFLSLCAKYFPSAVLSVGWTTGKHISMEKDRYEWRFVEPMRDLLLDVSQPITLPIRANMVGNSLEQILWLLSLSDQYTLTIWSKTYDKPNIKDLVTLRNKVQDKTRIFYDLPPDQGMKFMEELKHQN